MQFTQRNRPGHGEEKDAKYCKIHNQRIIQLGNCLTCASSSSICEAKGCMKNHQENERIHTVFTIEYVRHVVKDYLHNDQNKKSFLKKMIADYFAAAKKEMEVLYEEIYQSVDNFKFDNIIFREEENLIIDKLIQEDYNNVTCTEVAIIIPKLIKYTNFEDGHFEHLREYLKNEKEKVPSLMDSIILNLPYFRENSVKKKQNEFVEISSEWLREVNQQLRRVSVRPKKLRIKYSRHKIIQSTMKANSRKRELIRNLCSIDKITSIQQLQLYCVWNVQEQDFQVAFFEALLRYPFLKHVTVYTGYKITSTEFIDEVVSEGAIDVRVLKNQWNF